MLGLQRNDTNSSFQQPLRSHERRRGGTFASWACPTAGGGANAVAALPAAMRPRPHVRGSWTPGFLAVAGGESIVLTSPTWLSCHSLQLAHLQLHTHATPFLPSPTTACIAACFPVINVCFFQGSCPEDSVDPTTLVNGYKWGADAFRITEANESLLSLTCHNTYWEPHNVAALRQVRLARCLRALPTARFGLSLDSCEKLAGVVASVALVSGVHVRSSS